MNKKFKIAMIISGVLIIISQLVQIDYSNLSWETNSFHFGMIVAVFLSLISIWFYKAAS